MRISDWSSDVCSSDLFGIEGQSLAGRLVDAHVDLLAQVDDIRLRAPVATDKAHERGLQRQDFPQEPSFQGVPLGHRQSPLPTLGRMTPENPHAETASLGEFHRSEEHTSELQSLMRISYAVFCLKKKKYKNTTHTKQYR